MKLTILDWNQKSALFNKVSVEVNDKLTYAIKKLRQRGQAATKKAAEQNQEKIRDVNIDNAAVDEKGILIEKDGHYVFTIEKRKKVNEEERKINNEFINTFIEIEPFIVDIDSPEYARARTLFDDFEEEELEGLLFKEKGDGITYKLVKVPSDDETKPAEISDKTSKVRGSKS